MKLIGSLTSPYVRKVRIVMAEKKLDYQFVLEDVWGEDAISKFNPHVFEHEVVVELLLSHHDANLAHVGAGE